MLPHIKMLGWTTRFPEPTWGSVAQGTLSSLWSHAANKLCGITLVRAPQPVETLDTPRHMRHKGGDQSVRSLWSPPALRPVTGRACTGQVSQPGEGAIALMHPAEQHTGQTCLPRKPQ